MLASGFLLTRITKRLFLPSVTAYIVAGILIGPFALDLIPQKVVDGTDFLPDIALAFIAFGVGDFFRVSSLKKGGVKTVIVTLFESLTASLLVFVATFFVLRLPESLAILLSALASATAPASTMMTIRQTKSKGEFVDTLLQVVALDDVVGLLAYSVAISIAITYTNGGFTFSAIGMPILLNIVAIALSVLLGFGLKFLIPTKRTTDNRLIIVLTVLLLFCGICAALGVSPLLGCMAIGTVYINASGDTKLFKQLSAFSPPVLLLFFVRSGATFDLNALVSTSHGTGIAPLWLVGIIYFAVRIMGKYAGAFLGCALTKKPSQTRNYLGLALIPQAGVAIGLATLGARTIGGVVGNSLMTVILASSVLYELIGPPLAKLALYLSHSYPHNTTHPETENTQTPAPADAPATQNPDGK
jgi:Kef-type K+ transport system membrane component KefB